MCHKPCIDFGNNNLHESDVKGKRVIEVGSRDVNGSLRNVILPKGPAEYIGVDIEDGPGVDRICNVFDLTKEFGPESFDVVISTEMIEHVQDWRGAISQVKSILRPNGAVLILTRSKGFPYHGYPDDFWRFELDDMREVFGDLEIEALESDIPSAPGVFVKARKKDGFKEKDLKSVALFSIVRSKRALDVNGFHLAFFKIKMVPSPLFERLSTSFHYRFGRIVKR